MQVYSLPFNRKKIEFSEYQLELVAELSAESNSFGRSSIRRPSKATYVAIILSVLFHGIIVTIALSYFNKPEQKGPQLQEAPKSIKISYINKAKSKTDIENSENKEIRNPPIEKLTDTIVKPEIKPTRATKPVKTTPKIIKQSSSISPTIDTKISASDNAESELDPLVYDKNIEIYEPIPDALNDGTIVFNPNFRKKIEEIQKEKFNRSIITGFIQRQKDNEYFEFKPVGGSQTVRINGNCFVVPEQDVFALSQNIWSLLGNCENKIDKLNFDEPELKYRYNGKDD